MKTSTLRNLVCFVAALFALGACGSSNNNPLVPPPPPPPVTTIAVTGSVYDGPVEGGTLFVFAAADVNAALEAADGAQDRAAALSGAGPILESARNSADGATYSLIVPEEQAGEALFFIFDSEGAEDQAFADQPFNLEAVAVAGAAGSQMTVNFTPHTTLNSIQVRVVLDPEDDGTVIDAAMIQTEIDNALLNTLATLGESSLGDDLFPGGEDPLTTTDAAILETASTELGFAVRAAATVGGTSMDEALFLFAADIADGTLDGIPAMSFDLDIDQTAHLAAINDFQALGSAVATDMESISCTSAANSLRRACEFEALDEFFIGVATCAHNATEADAGLCLETYADDRDELLDECGAVTADRLNLCVATNDASHNPDFGPDFVANFIDPLLIGVSEQINPYFPMTQGAEWVFEGTFEEDGEMVTEIITITVTDKIKLVDGIRCLVVRDIVEVDGELIEDTDDWFAQDVDGNVWYCGEEVKDYETFDGDVPAIPELVAIDGSFKAGRDGDEAGIQLPSTPVVGDIFRQEVSFANAEDAIEILALDSDESSPAVSCNNNCLQTRDFSPLDPGVEENKYYVPGVGKILEVDLESGDRFELIGSTLLP